MVFTTWGRGGGRGSVCGGGGGGGGVGVRGELGEAQVSCRQLSTRPQGHYSRG